MKKQELIHLHGLLAEVGNHFEEMEGETLELDEYETLGVRPTSIHRSKTDHKAAVFALIGGVTTQMGESEETEALTAQAD